MSRAQQTSSGQQSDERFISVLEEVTQLKETYVGQQLHGYQKNATRARLVFRYSGFLIIVLSVSLPLLATLKGIWISIVLPIVALIVAGLTALNSFYRWESSWKGYSQTGHTLEYILKVWELKIIEAKHEIDAQRAIEIALQATKQLLDKAQATLSAEDEEFFKRIQVPRIQQS